MVRPFEFLLGVGLLAFLTQRQSEIVVRLGVLWLQPSGLFKFCLSLLSIPGLQQDEPEIIVSFGEFRILSHEITKNVGCASGIIILTQNQPQLHSGIDVAWIEADCVSKLLRGFFQALQLGQSESEVVVRFRQIWIRHNGVLEFLEAVRLIA